MAVPKQHRSKSRQGQARMHKNIKEPDTIACTACGERKLPHVACQGCGAPRGNEPGTESAAEGTEE